MQPRPLTIVTGTSRGIGATVAPNLALRGYDLAVTDIDSSGTTDTLKNATDQGAQDRFFRLALDASAMGEMPQMLLFENYADSESSK